MSYVGLAESGKFAYTRSFDNLAFANATGDVSGPVYDLRLTGFMGKNIVGIVPTTSGQLFGYDGLNFTLVIIPTGQLGGGGGNIIDTLAATLLAGNWSGPTAIVAEQPIYATNLIELGSGTPLYWSNIASPSGGRQLGIVSSGSGILKITDGWSGLGHLLYSPSNPTDWSTPVPFTVTTALDVLARATGILAGGTGNPAPVTETLETTLLAGDRTGAASGILIDSGDTIALAQNANLRWSSNTNPGGLHNLAIGHAGTLGPYTKIRFFNPSADDAVAISGGPITATNSISMTTDALTVANTSIIWDEGIQAIYAQADWFRNPQLTFAIGNGPVLRLSLSGILGAPINNVTYVTDAPGRPVFAVGVDPATSSQDFLVLSASGMVLGSGKPIYWTSNQSASATPAIGISKIGPSMLYTSGVHRANTLEIGPGLGLNQIALSNSGVALLAFNAPRTSTGATGWFNATIVGPLTTSGVRLTHDNNGRLLVQDALGVYGSIYYAPAAPTDWSAPAPITIGSALDQLVKATGILAGGTGNPPIENLEQTLKAGNWSGPYNLVLEQSSYFTNKLEISSGVPVLWSNIASPSGGTQLGIVASGSGILKITDGWSGLGHLYYSPSNPTDWSAPIPTNVTSALDILAKATGILAGGTGNPPAGANIIDTLQATLEANNYTGPRDVIFQQRSYYADNQQLGSGVSILWSNVAAPSGGFQLGLVASGSGILRITDGWSGLGHLFYSPSVPTAWGAPVPTNVTLALDALAIATGILAGGTGNPPSSPGVATNIFPTGIILQAGSSQVPTSGIQLRSNNVDILRITTQGGVSYANTHQNGLLAKSIHLYPDLNDFSIEYVDINATSATRNIHLIQYSARTPQIWWGTEDDGFFGNNQGVGFSWHDVEKWRTTQTGISMGSTPLMMGENNSHVDWSIGRTSANTASITGNLSMAGNIVVQNLTVNGTHNITAGVPNTVQALVWIGW